MLVETMTLDEMVHEIQKDDDFLYHKRDEMAKKDIKALKARGLKEFPYYYTREVVSNRKNRYILCFMVLEHTALKDPDKVRFGKYALLEKSGRGLYVYAAPAAGHGNFITEYTPHFFHRYAERSGLEGSPVQVIRHYITHNNNNVMTSAVADGIIHAAIATNEGVAFGVIENGHHITRTFVTYDLLFPDQKHFQELLMRPWRLWSRYATNKFDKEYAKLVNEDKDKLNEEINQAFVTLWETYAKKHLMMDVVVYSRDGISFELIDRDKVSEMPKSAPLKDTFKFSKKSKPEYKANLVESPIESPKKIVVGKRVTPATIFRRKKK